MLLLYLNFLKHKQWAWVSHRKFNFLNNIQINVEKRHNGGEGGQKVFKIAERYGRPHNKILPKYFVVWSTLNYSKVFYFYFETFISVYCNGLSNSGKTRISGSTDVLLDVWRRKDTSSNFFQKWRSLVLALSLLLD